jgi:high-affinity K+ transport system ATPase subunit B
LKLVGTIGIEDELQEGVPESIEMLRNAGLNVWMITGFYFNLYNVYYFYFGLEDFLLFVYVNFFFVFLFC